MKRILALAVIVFLFAGLGICDSIKLQQLPLKDTKMILTQTDLRNSSYYPFDFRDGKVVPSTQHAFDTEPQLDLTIDGETFTLTMKGGKPHIDSGTKAVPLRMKASSLDPYTVRLPNRKTHILAFPHAYIKGKYARIYYRSGCVVKGRVDKDTIAFYDNDCDGKYSVDTDSIQNSASLVYAPISDLLATTKGVHKIDELSEDGTQLSLSPYEGETGKLSFSFTSPERGVELHVAFKGLNTGITGAVKAGTKPLVVPKDDYTILYGLVYSNGTKRVVAGLTPNDMEAFTVDAGKTASIQLGGKLSLTFAPEVKGGKLNISPSSIKVLGESGELYTGFEYTSPPPRKSEIREE
ncbi:hypothetical protein ACFL4W_04280 [Planctomycetota bacterium]